MSRPVSSDLAENEQPVQAAQTPALQHLPPPEQEGLQAQILPQVSQAVSGQPKSLQGSLSAPQRPLLRSPQQPGNGSEQPEPESDNHQQREQRQYVVGEALNPIPPLSLRPRLPSADVDERGAAPSRHISGTASLVDPSLSAADSSTQSASLLSGSDSSTPTAAACSGSPNSVSLSRHRAQQRDKDSSVHSSLSGNGQREHSTRFSRKCAQSSNEECPRPSRKSKSCIGNSRRRTTREGSGCDFEKISEPNFTRECKSSERENPNLCAEKSSGSFKQRAAGEKQKSTTQEEPDSPKISCPVQHQTKRRELRTSTSAVSSDGFQERTSSPVHFTLTASHERDGWEPGVLPCTKATGESTNSAYTLPSSQPRGQRNSPDIRSQFPSTTHTSPTPDRHETRLFTKGRCTEKRKKTCKRRSTARSQQGERRQVPHAIHAEVDPAPHQQKQGCSQSPQSSPHSPILQRETALATPPTLQQGPAWGAERASFSLCSPRKTRRARDGGMGGQRQLWSSNQEKEGGKEALSTALTMLSQPSPQSAQSFACLDPDLMTPQPNGAAVSTDSTDQHYSPSPLKIKAEIVDEEYPYVASKDTHDLAKPEPEDNTLHTDQEKQSTAGEGPKQETEEVDQPADTPRQWSILYETSLSQSSLSCGSLGTLPDKDTKEELKSYLLKDVKLHSVTVTKEETERDIERDLCRDVKEDGDADIQNNNGKDQKENGHRHRIQQTNNSACAWSELISQRTSLEGDLKVVKKEPVGEVKKEEDGYESLTEVTPTFLENSLQTVQPLHLPSGDGLRTSRNQQRRKQKTPRQIRKMCVLQTEPSAKNESSQTDGDGDEIIKEGVLLTDDSTVLKNRCHWQYQPGCKSCMSHVCLEIPASQQSLPFSQTDSKEQESKCISRDGVNEARAFPGNVSGCDHLLNPKSLQIFGNHAQGWDISSSISLAGNVGSNQGANVVSTTSLDSKTAADCRGQMLQLKMVDVLPVQTLSTKGAVTEPSQQSLVQTASQSTTVMPVPATPLSLVRLPYITVPVHCPPIPAVFPNLPKQQIHPTASLPIGTAFNPKTAQQHPTYIPIVPKMPPVVSAVPTKLSVSGISQTMSNVAKGEALSGPQQSVQNAYTAIPSAVSVLNVQQQQPVETSGLMMPAVPQLGVVRSPMIPACAGSIPVLIFLPSLNQNAPTTQVKTDVAARAEGMTMAATAKPSPEEQGQEKLKLDLVSGKENPRVYVDGTSSDGKKQENHQHKVSTSTDRDSSTAGRRTESKSSRSREVDLSTESISKTTDNSESLAVCLSTSSGENTPRTSAKTTYLENGAEAASTATSDPGHAIKGIAEGSMTSGFPFHYDACKRAEEIVFSTTSRLPPQLGIKHSWKKVTAVTNTKLPGKKENSHTSTKKSSEETSKSASTSKSGRKRIASTRYDFHSDIELSDGSEKDDITPITSDDEWIPEKDSDGQSTPSSEEEDSHTKLRKRDSFMDFFHQKAKKRWRKFGPDMNVKKQRAHPAPWYNLSIHLTSPPQPREQTQNTAQRKTPEYKQIETKQQTPVKQNMEEKTVESTNDRKEESGQEKLEETRSALPSCALTATPVLKKRRKTPYTKEELTCRVCSKTFINIYRLRRHEFSHGDERPYVCDQCGKAFKQSGHRNEHRLTHNINKRSFLCNECGVVISSRSSFRYHLLSHKQLVAGNSISTASCEVSTPKENQDSASPGPAPGGQTRHSSHQKDPPEGSSGLQEEEAGMMRSCLMAAAYDCPHCILRFATAQSLNCHLESHKEVEVRCHVQPFTCGECGRSFTYRHNLEKHRECHLKPEKRADSYQRQVQAAIAAGKPHFVCDTCGKVYLRKETLTKHMKTHLGLKPFQCMECQKSFTQKIHLTVHSRLHTGSRPFQCRTCRCCFLDSTALARHVMRDVCKSESFSFNVGKRGRKPFHMVMDEKVKAIVKSNRERRQRKGPASLRCGLCSWTGRYEGFLRRHMQRRHPHHGHKAVKDSTKPSSKRNDVITTTTSTTSATSKEEKETAATKTDSPPCTENDATTVTSTPHPPTHTTGVTATDVVVKESGLSKQQQPHSAS